MPGGTGTRTGAKAETATGPRAAGRLRRGRLGRLQGWGGFGRGGPRGRGRGRARRGDVRAAVLALLAERPMHGYEIIGELAERTNGMWKPSPGSVYPTSRCWRRRASVAGEEMDGKRRFTLTDEGRDKVAEQADTAPWEQVAKGVDPELRELWDSFRQMAMACRQISAAGTADSESGRWPSSPRPARSCTASSPRTSSRSGWSRATSGGEEAWLRVVAHRRDQQPHALAVQEHRGAEVGDHRHQGVAPRAGEGR